jgi:histidinol dehydrogenase
MLTVLDARATPTEQIQARLQHGAPQPTPEMEAQVRAICERVRTEGDRALLEFTRQWDCPTLETLEVSEAEFEAAYRQLGEATLTAIRHAVARVRRFHKPLRPHSWHMLEAHGGWLGQLVRPLERVGVYAPGGRARYPSTVIMNAVPARVAGVDEIILCTPPQQDGSIPASVLVAAREAGVQRVFKVGGAQAVAAMAYGTETVPAVEKIVGPGNLYVALAKRLLWGIVGVDMWAGPSEVAIIADGSANPAYIAADMLTQLEHGAESVGYLFTPSEQVLAGHACRAGGATVPAGATGDIARVACPQPRRADAQPARSVRTGEPRRTRTPDADGAAPNALAEPCAQRGLHPAGQRHAAVGRRLSRGTQPHAAHRARRAVRIARVGRDLPQA